MYPNGAPPADDYRWTIGKRGTVRHKGDPNHPILTLCGIEAEHMAPADMMAEPGLRCTRCLTIERESHGT